MYSGIRLGFLTKDIPALFSERTLRNDYGCNVQNGDFKYDHEPRKCVDANTDLISDNQ
jgi:hypothetical protein